MARVVREISDDVSNEPMRWSKAALMAVHVAAENFLTHYFVDSVVATLHRGKVTLKTSDLRVVERLRDETS